MGEGIIERVAELEDAVRRAVEALTRLREENTAMRQEIRRLTDERKHVLGQVDAILKDIAKLELDRARA